MPDPCGTPEELRAGVLTVILLATLLGGPGATAAESPASEETESISWAALGIKGLATFRNFSHFKESPRDNRNFREEGVLQLEWGRKFSDWARFNIVAVARGDDDESAKAIYHRVQDTAELRSFVDVKEGALKLNIAGVDLAFGKQIYSWGTADGYNPTDNINPYDYLDVIDRAKMGVYSASANAVAGPVSLTLVLVPAFTPSREARILSRWVPSPQGVPSEDPRLPETPAGSILEPRQVPHVEVDNMQYAGRAKITLAGWDVSGSYYEGFENLPVLKQKRGTEFTFVPVYTRMRVPGFDFSTTSGKAEFHGEGAFKFVEKDGKKDRFRVVLGFNYIWDDLGISWLQHVMLIGEYARTPAFVARLRSRITEGTQFLYAFRDAPIGRVQLKFTEETQFAVGWTMDLSNDDNSYFLQFKLNHKLTDALHVETGVDAFYGDRDSFWGKWRDNDRFFFFLKYFF